MIGKFIFLRWPDGRWTLALDRDVTPEEFEDLAG